jgi:uncharacterized protein YkwD
MRHWGVILAILAGMAGAAAAQHTEIQTTRQGHPLQCRPGTNEAAQIAQCFQLLNQYRVSMGRSALAYDVRLEQSVEAHCHHMAVHNFFAHQGPPGEPETATYATRARACGTTADSENLAEGMRTASAVMTGWRKSPAHNANMLDGSMTRVGIGCYLGGPGGPYWGQVFGRGRVPAAFQPQNQPAAAPPAPAPDSDPPATEDPPPNNPVQIDPPDPEDNNPSRPRRISASRNPPPPPARKIVPAGLLRR